MAEIVDCRGHACPHPVISAKKALQGYNQIVVIVDNDTALENVTRMAENSDCSVSSDTREDGIYIIIQKNNEEAVTQMPQQNYKPKSAAVSGSTVVVIPDNIMGRGDKNLGELLAKGFLHALAEGTSTPDVIIFFNNGVKLAVAGSDTLDDLRKLESNGAKILVCGTCLDYFNIKDRLQAGLVSNMYDITETLMSAGRIVSL